MRFQVLQRLIVSRFPPHLSMNCGLLLKLIPVDDSSVQVNRCSHTEEKLISSSLPCRLLVSLHLCFKLFFFCSSVASSAFVSFSTSVVYELQLLASFILLFLAIYIYKSVSHSSFLTIMYGVNVSLSECG